MENKKRTAMICGISGQDGSYLAKYLLSKDYDVWGTSRDVPGSKFQNLRLIGVMEKVKLCSMAPEDFRSVFNAVKKCMPDEIYFLAGQSSVGLSFELPAETIQSVILGTLNMLEVCRIADKPIRFYHAGTSECFGDTKGKPADEKTPFHPRSPYAVAKSSAFWLVDNYREAYNLHACTGILFNHESPLRSPRFVTQKIVSTAKRIAKGSSEKLKLGRLDVIRDWGYASEYVEAMWLMLQQDAPKDYVIATGKSYSLQEFVECTFSKLNLDWQDYVEQSDDLFRPTDILVSAADPSKAYSELGWVADYDMSEVIEIMLNSQTF